MGGGGGGSEIGIWPHSRIPLIMRTRISYPLISATLYQGLWGVSEIRGTLLRSLFSGDPTIWGSIFGVPHFRKQGLGFRVWGLGFRVAMKGLPRELVLVAHHGELQALGRPTQPQRACRAKKALNPKP